MLYYFFLVGNPYKPSLATVTEGRSKVYAWHKLLTELQLLQPKCGFAVIREVSNAFSGTSSKDPMDHERPNDGKAKTADTLLIPTTRVVHERNVAVAKGCQMIVLTQTPESSMFFRLVCANFNVVPCPRRHFFNTTFNILTSVLSRLTTWMVNFWHSWRKGDTTPFWCCFLIPSLHRTGANQFPWWTTLKDLKHCTSARVYQYLAGRGGKQVINKSYLHIMESVSRWHDESLFIFFRCP